MYFMSLCNIPLLISSIEPVTARICYKLPDLINIKLLPLSFSLKLVTEIIHISWLIKFFN